jgi:GT2 family glycosyltransferase
MNELAGLGERWLPVTVDLREPLRDIPMDGHAALHLTLMSGRTPVGRVIVPCRAAVCTAGRLHPYVQRFAKAAVDTELSERFESVPEIERSVSIIVSTRNRADQLDTCLSALSALARVDAQVVVVDNGNDDGATERTARRHRADYVVEPLAGLDRARNRGLTVARYEIVLFTDDDVVVDAQWAFWLAAAFDDPAVVAATGLILPAELETAGQVEFEVLAGFVRTINGFTIDGSSTPPAAAGRAGAGASMAFRRDFIVQAGGFPEQLDGGRKTRSGGDTYALYLALRLGRRIRFEPRSIAHHRHRPERADGLATVSGYATGVVSYLLLAGYNTRDVSAFSAAAKWTAWRVALYLRQIATQPGSTATQYVRAQVRGALAAPRALFDEARVPPAAQMFDDANRPPPALRQRAPSTAAGVERSGRCTVSVVIPTQGRRPGLSAMVAELHRRHDGVDPLEVIVATDGPFRDADELISALGSPLAARVVTGSGGGAGAARNRGAAVATGDVLLFLDDDMSFDSNDTVAAHRRAHDAGNTVVVGPILSREEPTKVRRTALAIMEHIWWSDQTRHLSDRGQLDFNDLCSGNFSIRRELFAAVGGFAELERREDYELGLRLIDAGHSIVCAPDATVRHPSNGSTRGVMSRRRREGRADIGLVQKHPFSVTTLDLWSWPALSRRRRLLAHAAIDRPDLAFAVAATAALAVPLLDRVGSRRRLAHLLDLVIDTAYWSGVGDATNGFAEWKRQSARLAAAIEGAPRSHLDLDAVESWDPHLHGHHLVSVASKGEIIGDGDLRWGGLPFDRTRFAKRLADEFGVRADTAARLASEERALSESGPVTAPSGSR